MVLASCKSKQVDASQAIFFFFQVSAIAKKHNLKLHLDGARIFNAAVALGVPVEEGAKPFDTVIISLTFILGPYRCVFVLDAFISSVGTDH